MGLWLRRQETKRGLLSWIRYSYDGVDGQLCVGLVVPVMLSSTRKPDKALCCEHQEQGSRKPADHKVFCRVSCSRCTRVATPSVSVRLELFNDLNCASSQRHASLAGVPCRNAALLRLRETD